MTRVAVVPAAPLLLPGQVGAVDPAPELRTAVAAAVGWLVEEGPGAVHVLTSPASDADRARGLDEAPGLRVARSVLAAAGFRGAVEAFPDGAAPGVGAGADSGTGRGRPDALLVVADGSARRGEKAPGHLDERSFAYDAGLEEALMLADSAALESLDVRLGAELLARGVPAFQRLGELDLPVVEVDLDYRGDPFGVQYWVVRWHCAS